MLRPGPSAPGTGGWLHKFPTVTRAQLTAKEETTAHGNLVPPNPVSSLGPAIHWGGEAVSGWMVLSALTEPAAHSLWLPPAPEAARHPRKEQSEGCDPQEGQSASWAHTDLPAGRPAQADRRTWQESGG